MAGEEEIGAEEIGIRGEIAQWNVEVAALFQIGFQHGTQTDEVAQASTRAHSLPV